MSGQYFGAPTSSALLSILTLPRLPQVSPRNPTQSRPVRRFRRSGLFAQPVNTLKFSQTEPKKSTKPVGFNGSFADGWIEGMRRNGLPLKFEYSQFDNKQCLNSL